MKAEVERVQNGRLHTHKSVSDQHYRSIVLYNPIWHKGVSFTPLPSQKIICEPNLVTDILLKFNCDIDMKNKNMIYHRKVLDTESSKLAEI